MFEKILKQKYRILHLEHYYQDENRIKIYLHVS